MKKLVLAGISILAVILLVLSSQSLVIARSIQIADNSEKSTSTSTSTGGLKIVGISTFQYNNGGESYATLCISVKNIGSKSLWGEYELGGECHRILHDSHQDMTCIGQLYGWNPNQTMDFLYFTFPAETKSKPYYYHIHCSLGVFETGDGIILDGNYRIYNTSAQPVFPLLTFIMKILRKY